MGCIYIGWGWGGPDGVTAEEPDQGGTVRIRGGETTSQGMKTTNLRRKKQDSDAEKKSGERVGREIGF